ncbi:hypothetical protein FBEOM_3214 [Fusarium beomiforme]|uniref:Uncharacterized protein n=1 Tax=Fusarium beomiforme TaxID=44412 RepID=A0A9P5DZD3_9HYPO|nr:hypothetical protein FBEOM_3214 [Fusarium beomiforme]
MSITSFSRTMNYNYRPTAPAYSPPEEAPTSQGGPRGDFAWSPKPGAKKPFENTYTQPQLPEPIDPQLYQPYYPQPVGDTDFNPFAQRDASMGLDERFALRDARSDPFFGHPFADPGSPFRTERDDAGFPDYNPAFEYPPSGSGDRNDQPSYTPDYRSQPFGVQSPYSKLFQGAESFGTSYPANENYSSEYSNDAVSPGPVKQFRTYERRRNLPLQVYCINCRTSLPKFGIRCQVCEQRRQSGIANSHELRYCMICKDPADVPDAIMCLRHLGDRKSFTFEEKQTLVESHMRKVQGSNE